MSAAELACSFSHMVPNSRDNRDSKYAGSSPEGSMRMAELGAYVAVGGRVVVTGYMPEADASLALLERLFEVRLQIARYNSGCVCCCGTLPGEEANPGSVVRRWLSCWRYCWCCS